MRIDIYHHFEPPGTEVKLLQELNTRITKMAKTLDDLVAQVAALTTVDDSVVALLTDIKARLDAAIASGDPTKIQALSDALAAQTQRLADAVVANTPAA